MADYGDMFYGTLPEDTQDLRQVLAGIGRTLRDRAIAAGQRIGQSGQEAIALQNQAFADPRRPTRVTDEAALARLTDMIMAGPMGFAPAGMTKPINKITSIQEFEALAGKGKLQTAKTSSQEIQDLESGKSKFAELNLNWNDPKTFELVNKFESKGYKVVHDSMSESPLTYIFKNYKDVQPVLLATNQAERGKAYGYSNADIARFYMERFKGYPKEEIYQMYLRDIGGLLD